MLHLTERGQRGRSQGLCCHWSDITKGNSTVYLNWLEIKATTLRYLQYTPHAGFYVCSHTDVLVLMQNSQLLLLFVHVCVIFVFFWRVVFRKIQRWWEVLRRSMNVLQMKVLFLTLNVAVDFDCVVTSSRC